MVLRYIGEEGMGYAKATFEFPRVSLRLWPRKMSTWNGGGRLRRDGTALGQARRGRRAVEVILDFHTHIDEAEAFGWIDPPDKLIPLLDQAGIAKAACMTYVDLPGSNPAALDYVAGAVSRFPDRLIGFARLNPTYRREAETALRRAVEDLGFRGVKLHPTSTLAHPAAEPTVALLRLAGTLGVPVLFHCGDDPYTTPQAIAAGADQAPDAAVVLGHMGGYFHVDEAIAMAERHANLYLETSAMPYPAKIAEAVERVGAERVLFGSDGPGCNPALEVEKVRLAGLGGDAERLVLGVNAARLLGIEEVAP
jgi:predicted TIM-barrel fold metal-dependent hydrolase